MPKGNYLLIIDHDVITDELSDYFRSYNIDIIQQDTFTFLQNTYDLPLAIIIHWSILKYQPATIHRLYNQYPVPIIVINDLCEDSACITMLEAGADDYMIKPLYPRELHARIKAIRRRVLCTLHKPNTGKDVFIFNDWRLQPYSRQVFDDKNNELILSCGEYELLSIFTQHPQRILNREFLLQATKHRTINLFDRRIDIQISRLRQKIETDTTLPALIKTIRNSGYMFTARVIILKESDR
ncbi:MAG: response regulator transcription factor [bacterium]|nr:response regulator transcription factor [bacterium]